MPCNTLVVMHENMQIIIKKIFSPRKKEFSISGIKTISMRLKDDYNIYYGTSNNPIRGITIWKKIENYNMH